MYNSVVQQIEKTKEETHLEKEATSEQFFVF